MDKKTFLEELKAALSVLQEDELRDILDEYDQHIDMKVHKGLTEEEAIADFGNMKELTAEILEAYHVRADYGAVDGPAVSAGERRLSGLWHRFQASCVQCSKTVTGKLKNLGSWFKAHMKMDGLMKKAEEAGEKKLGFLTSIWEFFGRILQAAWQFCCLCLVQGWRILRWCLIHGWDIFLWCVGACWNIGWILFALFCGGFGLFSLFGLGLLAVLLAQGYPLAGVTIGTLGVNLILFAATGFSLTLLWKGRRKAVPEKKLIETAADRGQGEEDGCHA